MSSQEASPKSLPSAKEDLLPPRPTAVGPKIPGTGNLVVVWQLEGPPEEDLSLRKIAFEPAKDAKVVTAVPEDVPIGMNTETWMSMSNGKDGSVAGTITADLVSQLGSVEAQVSLALSAEERLLTLVDTSRTELSSSCREDEPPVRVVIKDAVFVVALVQAQEGVSSIIEARVTLIGRLPKVVGLDGVDGDAPHVALRYGRECGPIRLIVKVGDRDLSSEDDGVTSRVTPALPPGIELEKRGCVLRGVPRLSGRSQHSIVVTTAVGESEPFRIAIEVNIEESDMTRLRWAAAEGGLGIAAITDRISKGSPQRASEIYRHFAYTLPEHQQRQREFWAREKRDVIVVDASMSGKLQEIIDDPHHSDGDTTTRVLQLIPGTYTLPEGMLRLGDTPDYCVGLSDYADAESSFKASADTA
ncbi:hypothetical protein Pmar_PMAR013130 [Perkinsus marinus ATCC 50983]|uniref:Uncharacterized protein n=1 Tax=Perkinsus marinus (strain ATCC 50983 / TXsc) TaxID=423536 RepID=C5L4Z8_PERM5|nr:hypothetical protein Pmar_PMAR013130 [Perkinsus marinus ATCC 50983]EER08218.1 hypothetical protein Pmar_PMAR013130 [Perkinsus marinus ATCC 50983]|eukprot:XP_002776402.1 hypothetical protein Pmar_PMAR013130 [Perkinsus marinus ATCC 50983]